MTLARPLRAQSLTFCAGLAGALVFVALDLPAPWISGAMVGVAGFIAAGFRPVFPGALRDSGMLLAGCATGSTITPEMLRALEAYPASLGLLALTTFGVTYAGAFVLRRGFGWNPWSAFFAAVPGALSAVIASAGEVGAVMVHVVAAQALRLFALVAILPSLLMQVVTGHAVPQVDILSPPAFALVAGGGFVLALLLARLKIMTPWFLGGMSAAAFLHLSGLLHGTPPSPVANLALLLVGIYAASRMVGTTLATLRELWLPGVALLATSTGIALAGGYLTHWLAGVPIASALIAFAPGGLEAMVALGLALGLDPLYVSAHHVARFIILSFALPVLARHVPGQAAFLAARRRGLDA